MTEAHQGEVNFTAGEDRHKETTMATYYVQCRSGWQGSQWRTLTWFERKRIAIMLRDELLDESNARSDFYDMRVVSESALVRESSLARREFEEYQLSPISLHEEHVTEAKEKLLSRLFRDAFESSREAGNDPGEAEASALEDVAALAQKLRVAPTGLAAYPATRGPERERRNK